MLLTPLSYSVDSNRFTDLNTVLKGFCDQITLNIDAVRYTSGSYKHRVSESQHQFLVRINGTAIQCKNPANRGVQLNVVIRSLT